MHAHGMFSFESPLNDMGLSLEARVASEDVLPALVYIGREHLGGEDKNSLRALVLAALLSLPICLCYFYRIPVSAPQPPRQCPS